MPVPNRLPDCPLPDTADRMLCQGVRAGAECDTVLLAPGWMGLRISWRSSEHWCGSCVSPRRSRGITENCGLVG